MPEWNTVNFGASTSTQEERQPLLDEMAASTAHLVMNQGAPASKIPQFIAAISATLGGLAMGLMLAWTSPVQEYLLAGKYGFNMTTSEFDLVGSMLSVGAIVGALGTGPVADKIGRKTSMIVLVVPSIIGWCLIIWAENPVMMIIGRVIKGIGMGGYTVVCCLYTSEIGEISIRGTLGTIFQVQVTIGILGSYVIGYFVKPFMLSLISACAPIALAVLITFMPESPYYLLLKNKESAARKSLQWLRGNQYNVDTEIQLSKNTISQVESEKLSFTQAFSTTAAKKGLIIGLGVMFLQQFSGINAVVFYASTIFKDAGSEMDPQICSIVVGSVMVIVTLLSTLIIERLGRKPLLFISDLFMAIFGGILSLYFFLQTHDPDLAKTLNIVPLLSVCIFIVVFSIGFGPIPWMFLAEIFPPAIKGPASSIGCLFNWTCVFIITLTYSSIVKGIGQAGAFGVFAGISAVGSAFVWIVVPETKGKTIDEIQRQLGGSSASSDTTVEAGYKSKDFTPI